MRLLDQKFKKSWPSYILQCLLATLPIGGLLLIMDAALQTTLIAALGSSSFLAFAAPHSHASRPRYLLSGYSIGTLIGCLFSLLAQHPYWGSSPELSHYALLACSALAPGIAIFCMVITNTEHPPAAGLALGYVLSDWNLATIAIIFIGIIAISMVKETLKMRMIDLV
ncbi:MAG: HPP family protein [Gammaproteobacteria bacterium]|nr:HPP family protein [Gammaproteobacteria bacterium]